MKMSYFFRAFLACTFFQQISSAQQTTPSYFAGFRAGIKRAQEFAKSRQIRGLECPNPFASPAKPLEPDTLVIEKNDPLYNLLLATPLNQKNVELRIQSNELNYPAFPAQFKVILEKYKDLFTSKLEDEKRNQLIKNISDESVNDLVHLFKFFDLNELDDLSELMVQPIVDYYQKNAATYDNSLQSFLTRHRIFEAQEDFFLLRVPTVLHTRNAVTIENVGEHPVINADGSRVAYLVSSDWQERIEVVSNGKRSTAYRVFPFIGRTIKAFTFSSEKNSELIIVTTRLFKKEEFIPDTYKSFQVLKVDLKNNTTKKIYERDSEITYIGLSPSGKLLGVAPTNQYSLIDLATSKVLINLTIKEIFASHINFSQQEDFNFVKLNYWGKYRPLIISVNDSSIDIRPDSYLRTQLVFSDPYKNEIKLYIKHHLDKDPVLYQFDSNKFLTFRWNLDKVNKLDIQNLKKNKRIDEKELKELGIITFLGGDQPYQPTRLEYGHSSGIHAKAHEIPIAEFFFRPQKFVIQPRYPSIMFIKNKDSYALEHRDLSTGKDLGSYRHSNPIRSLQLSKEGNLLMLESRDQNTKKNTLTLIPMSK